MLLLDLGEYYLEDYIASLEISKNNTWLNGRLKVCSLSLVFDPKDYHKPIIKIPFSQIGSITQRFHLFCLIHLIFLNNNFVYNIKILNNIVVSMK